MIRSLLLSAADLVPVPSGPWRGDLEAARADLVAELSAGLAKLACSNYTQARKQLTAAPRAEEDYLALSEAEQDALGSASKAVRNYEADIVFANETWLTLQALASLAAGDIGPQVAARWQSHPWAVRTEILARYSWAQEQQVGLSKGWKFSSPYRCTVTKRNVDRQARTVDREHYQLINYLHALSMTTGERLLWSRKGETPDFHLADEAGRAVGAEMGEAPISTQWAAEEDAKTDVLAVLEPLLTSLGYDLSISDESSISWQHWLTNFPAVDAAIKAAVAGGRRDKQGQIALTALGVSGELAPGSGWVNVHWTDTHAEQAVAAQDMATALCTTVAKKLVNQKTGRPRKVPSVGPCDLVLYPNGDGWPDPAEVLRLASAQIPAGWNVYFDRIWMSSESFLGQLA